MDNKENLFGEYIADKTIKGRVKNPKTWVNLLILIVVIAMLVILIQSVRGSWTKQEIKNSIEIIDFNSTWVIKKIGFSNKGSKKEVSIIPQVTFKVKNVGKRKLGFIRFIGNFVYAEKRASSIGDGYYDILKDSYLKPGEISDTIYIKSTYGYKTSTGFEENYNDMFFNKKGWKQFNVRISARVKGTVKEIAEYPVNNSIEDGFGKGDKDLDNNLNYGKNILKSIKISEYKSEWKHIKSKDGNLFIPTITIRLKNSGDRDIKKLNVNVSFEFDEKKDVITQWKGRKGIVIDDLSVNAVSEEMIFEAENGIKATSVEKLFLNKVEWEKVFVKIFIGTKNLKPSLLEVLKMKQNVRGYKVRERVIR